MAQYINKASVVAEIERRMKLRQDKYGKYSDVCDFVAFEELEYFHDEFLPTLEVKGVDLEKEVIDWWNAHYSSKAYTFEGYSGHYLENSTVINIAKHFFELGLKAKGE